MAQDLTGKVFLVTGATEGIGKAAVTNFAKRGATVTLIGRNKEKTGAGSQRAQGCKRQSQFGLSRLRSIEAGRREARR